MNPPLGREEPRRRERRVRVGGMTGKSLFFNGAGVLLLGALTAYASMFVFFYPMGAENINFLVYGFLWLLVIVPAAFGAGLLGRMFGSSTVSPSWIEQRNALAYTSCTPSDVTALALVERRSVLGGTTGRQMLRLTVRTHERIDLPVRETPQDQLLLKAAVEVVSAQPGVRVDPAVYRLFGRPPYGVFEEQPSHPPNRPSDVAD